ncbi:hypothetical protein MPH_09029 [Macrophomina phaseolina MS6]|uniref:Uncharacterized protein n=1 Tax=Macrophomina phaseolina (strain MS6) TaxID=1126212 RepID=K2QVN2_MACPH|nr:hypothetical protein MPH_09029 [Macrophomina phaseolina MS6]
MPARASVNALNAKEICHSHLGGVRVVVIVFFDRGLWLLFYGILLSTKNTRQSVAYSGYQGLFLLVSFSSCIFLALKKSQRLSWFKFHFPSKMQCILPARAVFAVLSTHPSALAWPYAMIRDLVVLFFFFSLDLFVFLLFFHNCIDGMHPFMVFLRFFFLASLEMIIYCC